MCSLKCLPFYSENFVAGKNSFDKDSGKDINEVQVNKANIIPSKGITFFHLNVCSLLPKISEIRLLAKDFNIAVLAISETWLNPTVLDSEITINGYNLVRKDRGSRGGGVCIYTKDNLQTNPRTDITGSNIESVWTEIHLPKTKPILVGACYRPPKQSDFLTVFEEEILSKLNPDYDTVILGDFNICTLRESSALTKKYKNLLQTYNLKQIIKVPTRQGKSESILDHILCNMPEKIVKSGTISKGISDHDIIFCTKGKMKHCKNTNSIKIRSLKHYNKEKLVECLNEMNWSLLYSEKCIDEAWGIFKKFLLEAINKVAPYKEIKMKANTEKWITLEIVEKMKQRDILLNKYRRDKNNEEIKSNYKKCRNNLIREIRNSKAHYIQNQICVNQKNPKQLWKNLHLLGYEMKQKGQNNIVLDIEGQRCYDSKVVANFINTFFTNIAHKLVDLIPKSIRNNLTQKFKLDILYKHVKSTLTLKEVSIDFVQKELDNINTSKGTGLDTIPGKFVKDASKAIVYPLTYLINLSINTQTFPKDFKKAKITPIYKKENHFDVGNYRPVSVLSVCSKILEKAIHSQLYEYLNENKLIYELQSGFRSSYSTQTCLIYLQDFIKSQTASGKYTGMILLDIQKAFDCVNHEILIQKLCAIGVNSVDWFKSYLSDREQTVIVDGVTSDVCYVTCGVPQGSVLGPLLFLVYMNDLSLCIDIPLIQYADDSALLVADKDINNLTQILNQNLMLCNEWLSHNLLTMHPHKTEFIMFGPPRKLKKLKNVTFEYQGYKIISKNSVKYLGLILNNHLDGKEIVNSIIKKVNSKIHFMYRQAKYLDLHTKKILCTSLIAPLFDYSLTSYYCGLSNGLKAKLQISENKVIRFILNYKPQTHLFRHDFACSGFLKIADRDKQLRLNIVHNIFNGKAPQYLLKYFKRLQDVHGHNTRGNKLNFYVPKVTEVTKKTFFYNSILDWNSLPPNIKQIENKLTFKKGLKFHIKVNSS
jgi:hypothetical protein